MAKKSRPQPSALNTTPKGTNLDEKQVKRQIKAYQKRLKKSAKAILARKHLKYFMKFVMYPAGSFPLTDFQWEWMDFAENTPDDGRRLLIAPRGFGKSFTLSYNWLAWRVLCGPPNERILMFCRNGTEAKKAFNKLYALLTQSHEVKEFWGDVVESGSTSDLTLTTTRRQNTALKEPTLTVKSIGSTVVGYHVDHIHFDDITDESNTRTAKQRKDLMQTYRTVINNTLDPGSIATSVATRYHPDDIISHWMKDNSWDHKIYKAIKDDGTALWPEQWPLDRLARKRNEITPPVFKAQFMNDIDAISKENLIRTEDLREYHLQDIDRIVQKPSTKTYIGVDPAITTERQSDYTAIVIAHKDEENNWYIRDCKVGKWPIFRTSRKAEEIFDTYGADFIIVEQAGFQRSIIEILEDDGYPVVEETFDKGGKKARGRYITSAAIRGKLYLPKDFALGGGLHTLHEQILYFPDTQNDDAYDALSLIMKFNKQKREPEFLFV